MSINLLESHDSLYFLISDRMTESITCSICLSTLNNPVLTRCGYHICCRNSSPQMEFIIKPIE